MKAISLWQPWAYALFCPNLKPIETRHWKTNYRGPLVMHAALKESKEIKDFIRYKKESAYVCSSFQSVFGPDESKWFPRGVLLGTIDLVDCLATAPHQHDVTHPNREVIIGYEVAQYLQNSKQFTPHCPGKDFNTPSTWGDFGPERFGWVMANPKLFREPIPYKGAQGFFNVEIPQ